MKSYRTHNCSGSPAPFPWELIGAVPLLLLASAVAMEVPAGFPGLPGAGVAALAFAGLGGLLLLNLFLNSGCLVSDSVLVIYRPMRSRHILYRNISRVDRVRRVAHDTTGGVRITYRRGRQTQTLKLTPECPEALVDDILEHCPHLTGTRTLTLVRDRSFKAIKTPSLEEMGEGGDVW